MTLTVSAVLELLLRYGPAAVDMARKLAQDIAAGRGNQPVTDAMWLELDRLANQTAGDIYARLGITPPGKP